MIMSLFFVRFGPLELRLYNGPASWSEERKAALVEHEVIDGLPHLEGRGQALRRLRLELLLDVVFGDIGPALAAWHEALAEQTAHDLIRGDGSPVGRFAVESLSETLEIAAQDGTALRVRLEVGLIEAPEPAAPLRLTGAPGLTGSPAARQAAARPPDTRVHTNPDGFSVDLIS
jgi:hypothetical protein